MAILSSMPGEGNKVNLYDIPDSELKQYAVTGDKAAQMFPESQKTSGGGIAKSSGAMNPSKLKNAESLGEVQAYSDLCICRQLWCNAYGCWWEYYYCYC